MKNNQKRTAILKTAIRCIAQHGIEGTSADVIAKKLGIAQSGIFYYFPKQEDIFDSLVDYIASANHDVVTKYLEQHAPKKSKDLLLSHLVGNLRWAEKYPEHVSVLLITMAKTGRSRTMRDRVNRIFQVGEQRIVDLLKDLKVRGDVRELGAFIHQSLTGVIICHYYSQSLREMAFFETMLLNQTKALLPGIGRSRSVGRRRLARTVTENGLSSSH